MKIFSIEITDPEQVKILNEGLAAMKEYLRLRGVTTDLSLSTEGYDKMLKEIGAGISGEAYVKLLKEIDALEREKGVVVDESE